MRTHFFVTYFNDFTNVIVIFVIIRSILDSGCVGLILRISLITAPSGSLAFNRGLAIVLDGLYEVPVILLERLPEFIEFLCRNGFSESCTCHCPDWT